MQVKEKTKVNTIELEAPASAPVVKTAEPSLATGLIALGVAGLAALLLGSGSSVKTPTAPSPKEIVYMEEALGFTSMVKQLGPAKWEVVVTGEGYRHAFVYEAQLIEDPEEPGNYLINHYLDDQLNDTTSDDIYELYGHIDTIVRFGYIENGVCIAMLHDDIEPEQDWLIVDGLLDKVVDTLTENTWTEGFERELPGISFVDEIEEDDDDIDPDAEDYDNEEIDGGIDLPPGSLPLIIIPANSDYWNKYLSSDGNISAAFYKNSEGKWIIEVLFRDLDNPTPEVKYHTHTVLDLSKGGGERYGIKATDWNGSWSGASLNRDEAVLAAALRRFICDTRTTDWNGRGHVALNTLRNQMTEANRINFYSFIDTICSGLAESIKAAEEAEGK